MESNIDDGLLRRGLAVRFNRASTFQKINRNLLVDEQDENWHKFNRRRVKSYFEKRTRRNILLRAKCL